MHCEHCAHADACLGSCLDKSAKQKFQKLVMRSPIFHRGEYLFTAGDPLEVIYTIRSGSVKLSCSSADGDERILGFYLPGALLGFDGFSEDVHSCSAVALETTSVCYIPLDGLMNLCRVYPELNQSFYHEAGSEIQRLHALCTVLDRKNAEERLAHFLVSLSEYFEHHGMSSNSFQLKMSRQDIANYLGLVTETVSRAFTHLQAEKIISVERRLIHILDTDALTQLAHEASASPRKSLIN